MKKYVLVFILLSLLAIINLLYPFNFKRNEHFVSIHNNKFQLNGKDFYPITLNYIVSLQADKNAIWACPYLAYNNGVKHRFTAKDSCLMQLKAEMDLIKEMGFNSVRLVGIGEIGIEDRANGILAIGARIGNKRDTAILLSSEKSYEAYFNAVAELLDVINKAGLKAIFLNRTVPGFDPMENHLERLAIRFQNDTALMAYDLFNEPLYFDTLPRTKEDIRQITLRWNRILKMYAPNQLFTLGLTGIREVFEWDPNILDVDFVSFHPYEYEPEEVRNEIYWYGTYVKKPWMLGETAVTADDSLGYQRQRRFAAKTLKQTYNCGGIGYSWWQYKDVDWKDTAVNNQGVVNREGQTFTKNKNIPVDGTPKPVVEEFKQFNPAMKKDSCICLANYYNYSNGKKFKIKGYLMDKHNKPIKGGVILAWNLYWSKSYHTVTKEDGSFELTSSFNLFHWMASATEYSMVRGDVMPFASRKYADGIPTVDIGVLQVKKIRF